MRIHLILSVMVLMVCSLYSNFSLAHDGFRRGGFQGNYYGGHHRGYYGGYQGGYYGGRHFGHSGFGLYFGLPYSGFSYSYPNYGYQYYSPPVINIPSTPPVYIQQTPSVVQEYPAGYWYYCSNPEGYYPYVKECPNGWQQVAPTPPPASR